MAYPLSILLVIKLAGLKPSFDEDQGLRSRCFWDGGNQGRYEGLRQYLCWPPVSVLLAADLRLGRYRSALSGAEDRQNINTMEGSAPEMTKI
jgi:hypothetical protein